MFSLLNDSVTRDFAKGMINGAYFVDSTRLKSTKSNKNKSSEALKQSLLKLGENFPSLNKVFNSSYLTDSFCYQLLNTCSAVVEQLVRIGITFFTFNEALKSAHLMPLPYLCLTAAASSIVTLNMLAIQSSKNSKIVKYVNSTKKVLNKVCLCANFFSSVILITFDKKTQGITLLTQIGLNFVLYDGFHANLRKSTVEKVKSTKNVLTLASLVLVLPSYFKSIPTFFLLKDLSSKGRSFYYFFKPQLNKNN